MSPQILRQDKYTFQTDIWSLGITCIELAERKPPLYNMNAMSALYHIAQNDSPSLTIAAGLDPWSNNFKKFIGECVQKNPAQRPSANELLKHEFIALMAEPRALLELIRKTKEIVRDLDNLQYRKMKKIIMTDASASNTTVSSHSSTSALPG